MRRAAAWIVAAFACLLLASGQSASAQSRPSQPATEKKTEFDRISEQASKARNANDLPKAIDLYQKALKLNSRWKEGWWYLGTLYYDGNQYSEGVDAFKNLVELDRSLGTAWAMLGLCEFGAGDANMKEGHQKEAMGDYANSFIHLNQGIQKGLANNQDLYGVTHYHLALLEIMHGDFDSASSELSHLAEGAVSNQVRFALGLTLLRVPLLPSQVDPTKDAVIDKAGEAGELMAQKDYNDAEEVFKQLIQDFPNTPYAHYAYGTLLSMLAQPDKAAEEFKEEIKINSGSPWPYIQLANVDLRLNQYQEALANSRKGLKLLPGSPVTHYLVGRSLLAVGQVHAAVLELTNAKNLAPSVAEIRFNLAMALERDHQPKAAARERAAFQRLEAAIQQQRRLVPTPDNSTGASGLPGTAGSDQAKAPPENSPQ